MLVPEIVLHDQNRSDAALFRSDDGAQIRIIYVPAFDLRQVFHSPSVLFTTLFLHVILRFKHLYYYNMFFVGMRSNGCFDGVYSAEITARAFAVTLNAVAA